LSRKLYISSTFRDLEDYRLEMLDTLDFLEKEGYFEIVTPMEKMMPGSSQPPVEECLELLDTCHIYMLIIGKRYGGIADEVDGLSFTEREYNKAVSRNKIILLFVADEEAQGLEEIAIDDKAKYDRFKDKVMKKHTTFVHPFLNPDHLSTQAVLALYKFSEKKMASKQEVKFYCDRIPQYHLFMAKKKKHRLNVFTMVCKRHDMPGYFSKRMACYEFGAPEGYLEDPIRGSLISDLDYERNKSILINHLIDKYYLDKDSDRPQTLKECFKCFTNQKLRNVFILFSLSKTDIEEPGLKRTLEKFFQELSTECSACNITMYINMVFEFGEKDLIDRKISRWVLKNKKINCEPANVFDIENLSAVQMDDVRDWIDKFILDPSHSSARTRDAINTHLQRQFNKSAKGLTMETAFDLLGEIIEMINHTK
jgi:hypothetical protein